MACIRDIVFDCQRPAVMARFWSSILESYRVAAYDDAELTRLKEMGIDDPADDPTVLVETDIGGPRLWFQKVPEPKTVKNRIHLDLACDDVGVELERLQSFGATIQAHQPNDNLIVLEDPEGNEFCLLR